MLYKALLLPVYDYCNVCHDTLNQEQEDRLQHLHNAACRGILQVDNLAPPHSYVYCTGTTISEEKTYKSHKRSGSQSYT